MSIAHPIGALICLLSLAGAICFLIAIYPSRDADNSPSVSARGGDDNTASSPPHLSKDDAA